MPAAYPSDDTLAALFRRTFAAFRGACALRDEYSELTYEQLDRISDAVADALAQRGTARGDRVVLYAKRTAHAVASMVGIWKAGAGVVPVSLDTPPLRLAYIVGDADASLVLVDGAGRESLGEHASAPVVDLLPLCRAEAARDRAPVALSPHDLAYVIYTSGTSGKPKGVMIEHRSIVRRFCDWDERFGLTRKPPRILQVAKLGFDVFTADVVKALGSGGTLVICPDESVLDPYKLCEALITNSIDYLDIVPAIVRLLVDVLEETGQSLESLSILNCGADRWTAAEYRRFRKVTRVAHLFNGYGLTECTVENTLFEDDGVTLDRKQTLPIGTALASDRLIIVDDALDPVPPDVPGQICIGGPCVARGYLNRPDLNATAFFERRDPEGTPVRFYKTGDLGRMDAQGVVEFLGRMDAQIKIRGQRIELGEIERVLENEEGVGGCAVCFEPTEERLIAFLRMERGARFNAEPLARSLESQLPRFMIPTQWVPVGELPMTSNGKVDRARLLELAPPAARRRRKHPHDLHLSQSVAELQERLGARDIDLQSVIAEFVKPGYSAGVLVAGSLADRVATDVSDLDLLVLLEHPRSLKRPPRELFGAPVAYLPGAAEGDTQASLFLGGIEIDLQLVFDPVVAAGGPAVVRGNDGGVSIESGLGVKFLSKLSSDWVVQGPEIVERWQRHYRIDQFRLQRVLHEFTAASKNLEDLRSGIGLEVGHVGVLGINVVSSLLRVVLYFNGYRGLSRMWMRVLGRMLATADEETGEVLRQGRRLMFPELLRNADAELRYCQQVHALWSSIRSLLARDSEIEPAIESILHRFDVSQV